MSKNFKQIEYTLDQNGRVVIPAHIGDGELVEVTMGYKKLILLIHNHGAFDVAGKRVAPEKWIKIDCEKPNYFSLESDQLQNVIEDIWIFNDKERAREFRTFSGKDLMPKSFAENAELYIFVTPISGIEAFVAAETVRFFESQSVNA